MLNEWLLAFARWLDAFSWSTQIHESLYLYSWIESTHVLTLMVFLGMLFIIDLRMLGFAFTGVPASTVAERLDLPMKIGMAVMITTGFLLYFAIPVRSTQSIWFRMKVVLMIGAIVNALIFRKRMLAARDSSWDNDAKLPRNLRLGAGISLGLWSAIVITGRTIAYDWYDCFQKLPYFMYWAAGCVDEMAAIDQQGG